MSEVTQKICDGCGVAGKKGEPTYGMSVSLYPVGRSEMASRKVDVHPDSKCVKAMYRKLSGEAEQMLQETLRGSEAEAAD
jgi:hypothetical protein